MSGTVCCYKGCLKSYSTNKEVTFFKFPDDIKRRKKWMDNCGVPDLHTLNERQLRSRRVCSDHFDLSAFIFPETRNQLNEKAIPLSQKEFEALVKAAQEAEKEQELNPKRGRGRGRPANPKFSLVLVKKEVIEDDESEVEEEEEEEEDDEEEEDEELEEEKDESWTAAGSGGGGSSRRMADLSVIDDVIRHITDKKRQSVIGPDERILSKRIKTESVNETDLVGSEEDLSEMEDSDDDDDNIEKANREFEMFQEGLNKIIKLPPKWGMGSVIWDPSKKMKVIAISEMDILPNGHVSLIKSIQIFENSSVSVRVEGVDMTVNFGFQSIESEEDVNKVIKTVAEAKVCAGVKNFQPDDLIYLPEARKRGFFYYSESCPVILDKSAKDALCPPCTNLQAALLTRKLKEKEELATRKMRPVSKTLKNKFGKSFYGLLNEILHDSKVLKSDSNPEREKVLSKYSTDVGVVNGEVQKPEKLPHVHVSEDQVSRSFLDIVEKLGFSKNKRPGTTSSISTSMTMTPRPRPIIDQNRPHFVSKPFLSKFQNQQLSSRIHTPLMSSRPMATSTPLPISGTNTNSSTFSLGDGQTYEILGEVGGADVMQGPKGEAIEIIEVDDETMAKLTAQNSGMLLDPSDPNISQILKAINPSQP